MNIIKCEWSGPLARQKLQSLLQLSVTFQRFTIMSRVPYDLPQRLKGAFVPDVCVWWTRDIKFEVSWCLWPNGSLRAAFKHESNLPSVLSNYFYIWGKKWTFLALTSVKWKNLEVEWMKMCWSLASFATLKQLGWDSSTSSWQKINWTVSQEAFRPCIHQKKHD